MWNPLCEGEKDSYPQPNKQGRLVCPVCKKNKVGEPHVFVVLNGGALYGTEMSAGPHKKMKGFLEFIYHDDDKYVHQRDGIANGVKYGQFDIYTCSIKCMRKLINKRLDTFEAAVKKEYTLTDKQKRDRSRRYFRKLEKELEQENL